MATCAAPLASPPLRPPPPISSWLCAQLEFGKSRQPTEENSYNDDIITPADLTKADFQKASFTTTGKNADVDFSGAKLNDANFNDAVVKASGENSAVKNDPTA